MNLLKLKPINVLKQYEEDGTHMIEEPKEQEYENKSIKSAEKSTEDRRKQVNYKTEQAEEIKQKEKRK